MPGFREPRLSWGGRPDCVRFGGAPSTQGLGTFAGTTTIRAGVALYGGHGATDPVMRVDDGLVWGAYGGR